jgi:AmmeMemoRadiSam system protein A
VSPGSNPSPEAVGADLSQDECRTLLRVAREALVAHFARRPPTLPAPTAGLAEKRGAFVTLHRRVNGDLRGCVGMMRSDRSLLETVARMAVSAATEDGRFDPVTADELPGLQIEISALGPLRPIRPEEVEVGRHGLWISHAGRRGVLLPQVPVEQGWDRETFLDRTCWKAGLPEGTWHQPGVELLGFTATVFGEDGSGARP